MSEPFLADPDFTLFVGDALETLREIPDESVHCCVTSPPYWGLRDYGTAEWEGGDPDCAHTFKVGGVANSSLGEYGNSLTAEHIEKKVEGYGHASYRGVCGKCGAHRIDQQLGLEPSPAEYVASMVAIFREVRRVLRSDGTCWLNLGDSYANDTKWGGTTGGKHAARLHDGPRGLGREKQQTGLKAKDLVGIPWRVAFALQEDGWWIRSDTIEEVEFYCPCGCGHILEERVWRYSQDRDLIWRKPNPMPESVTDRPTKSHEYLFLLTKSARYDAEAIAEPANWWGPNGNPKDGPHSDQMQSRAAAKRPQQRRAAELAEQHGLTEEHFDAIRSVGISDTGKALTTTLGAGRSDPEKQRLADEAKEALGGYYREFLIPLTRNARSVWTVQTQQFADAHFATFPEELPRRCIAAGTSEHGCCPKCGAPWERVLETSNPSKHAADDDARDWANTHSQTSNPQSSKSLHRNEGGVYSTAVFKGWQPTCACAGVDLSLILTPTGETAGEDPTMEVGRKGLERPRGDGEGTRPITRYEQQQYAAQLKDSPARPEMAAQAGVDAFAHYIRTDESGARPVPPDLLEHWISIGWLDRVEIPELELLAPVPCTVLDPFMGSGTTAFVARKLGRRCVGIELNPEYAELIAKRTRQLSLFA